MFDSEGDPRIDQSPKLFVLLDLLLGCLDPLLPDVVRSTVHLPRIADLPE